MADDSKIPVTYVLDHKTGDIHRKMGKGNEIIEDIVVANYAVKTKTLTFATAQARRLYYEPAITFLAMNEMTVRHFQRADLKADKPMDAKDIPPRPKKMDVNGDKTAAIVDWYLKYRWNEFCTRYGYLGTYTGLVRYLYPVWVKRPGDGLLEYRGTEKREREVENAIVTTQKTHRTYVPGECVDWSEREDDPTDLDSTDGESLSKLALAGDNTVEVD